MIPQKVEYHENPNVMEMEPDKVLRIVVPTDPIRSVADAKEARLELEEAITALYLNFQDRTGYKVEQINFTADRPNHKAKLHNFIKIVAMV